METYFDHISPANATTMASSLLTRTTSHLFRLRLRSHRRRRAAAERGGVVTWGADGQRGARNRLDPSARRRGQWTRRAIVWWWGAGKTMGRAALLRSHRLICLRAPAAARGKGGGVAQ